MVSGVEYVMMMEHGLVPWLRYARSLRFRETSGLGLLSRQEAWVEFSNKVWVGFFQG